MSEQVGLYSYIANRFFKGLSYRNPDIIRATNVYLISPAGKQDYFVCSAVSVKDGKNDG
jgi:hypothetical protein